MFPCERRVRIVVHAYLLVTRYEKCCIAIDSEAMLLGAVQNYASQHIKCIFSAQSHLLVQKDICAKICSQCTGRFF